MLVNCEYEGMNMIKLGPAVGHYKSTGTTKLKEKGHHTQIFQIFIWYNDESILAIQFQFVDDGRLVFSPRYGSSSFTGNDNFEAVKFSDPLEYLTSLTVHTNSTTKAIASLTFCTDHGTYGPYGVQHPVDYTTVHFGMGEEGSFAGIIGTEDFLMLMSNGVCFELPVTRLSMSGKMMEMSRKIMNGVYEDLAKFVSLFSLEIFFFAVFVYEVLLLLLLWFKVI